MSTSLSTNRCAMVCYVLRMIATGDSMKCLEIAGLMHHSAERCIWGVEERSSRIALRSIRATDSIPIVLDLQQRERAEHVRRIGGRRRAQVGTIELGETRHAEQAERALHLVLDELEHAHDAGLPGRRETPRRSLEHAAGDGSAAGAWSAAKCGNGAPGLRCAPSGLQIQYR